MPSILQTSFRSVAEALEAYLADGCQPLAFDPQLTALAGVLLTDDGTLVFVASVPSLDHAFSVRRGQALAHGSVRRPVRRAMQQWAEANGEYAVEGQKARVDFVGVGAGAVRIVMAAMQ